MAKGVQRPSAPLRRDGWIGGCREKSAPLFPTLLLRSPFFPAALGRTPSARCTGTCSRRGGPARPPRDRPAAVREDRARCWPRPPVDAACSLSTDAAEAHATWREGACAVHPPHPGVRGAQAQAGDQDGRRHPQEGAGPCRDALAQGPRPLYAAPARGGPGARQAGPAQRPEQLYLLARAWHPVPHGPQLRGVDQVLLDGAPDRGRQREPAARVGLYAPAAAPLCAADRRAPHAAAHAAAPALYLGRPRRGARACGQSGRGRAGAVRVRGRDARRAGTQLRVLRGAALPCAPAREARRAARCARPARRPAALPDHGHDRPRGAARARTAGAGQRGGCAGGVALPGGPEPGEQGARAEPAGRVRRRGHDDRGRRRQGAGPARGPAGRIPALHHPAAARAAVR